MSTDIDYDAIVQEYTTHKDTYDFQEELLAAGNFVAMCGTFGELFQEPDLTRAQFWTGNPNAAWNLLGHWSVQRNDPAGEPDDGFYEHEKTCEVCKYLEGVRELRVTLEDEPCWGCSLGMAGHDVAPDDNGEAGVVCRPGQWERREPWVSPAGDPGGDIQVGDAYDARWAAPLTDGTFALVTRAYCVTEYNGRFVVERQDEYLVCRDLADPGGTEENAEYYYNVEVDGADPADEDLEARARDSLAPELGEWQRHAPDNWRALLAPAQ